MYDNICKFLAESYSQDFAQWLLGYPLRVTQLSPSELSSEPIRADALILLRSEPVILHLEFQTQPDPAIPFRMADYRLRVFRRYPDQLMRQIVIYLKMSRSEQVYRNTFEISGMRHEFEVIRLWEVPSSELLAFPGLLPLAILGRSENKTATLQDIARQITTLPSRTAQSNVMAATAVLAGLVLEKAVIQQILREDVLRESVIYQDILQEGWQEGLQQGLQQGLHQGLQQGLQQGEATLVLRLLQRRIGPLDQTLESQIRSLSIEQLEALGEALLDFTQPDELTHWLQHNA